MRRAGTDVTLGSLVARQPWPEIEILVTPHVGITQCAELPLRFLIAGNRL
jgi:3-methyladenine DNA glycosylase Mpg